MHSGWELLSVGFPKNGTVALTATSQKILDREAGEHIDRVVRRVKFTIRLAGAATVAYISRKDMRLASDADWQVFADTPDDILVPGQVDLYAGVDAGTGTLGLYVERWLVPKPVTL